MARWHLVALPCQIQATRHYELVVTPSSHYDSKPNMGILPPGESGSICIAQKSLFCNRGKYFLNCSEVKVKIPLACAVHASSAERFLHTASSSSYRRYTQSQSCPLSNVARSQSNESTCTRPCSSSSTYLIDARKGWHAYSIHRERILHYFVCCRFFSPVGTLAIQYEYNTKRTIKMMQQVPAIENICARKYKRKCFTEDPTERV